MAYSDLQSEDHLMDTIEEPWGNDTSAVDGDIEWTKLSTEYTTSGYREGITAGKEAALQEGFDAGFAQVGAPLGLELGLLRGLSSALLSFVSSPQCLHPRKSDMAVEARAISAKLADVRFTDIAPRDLEAEVHAREHLEGDLASANSDLDVNEDTTLEEKRRMEEIEDKLAQLSAGTAGGGSKVGRPTIDDVRAMKAQLEALSTELGLVVDLTPVADRS